MLPRISNFYSGLFLLAIISATGASTWPDLRRLIVTDHYTDQPGTFRGTERVISTDLVNRLLFSMSVVVHSSKTRTAHENKQYIELDASILGFSYELSEDKNNYKVLRYGRSSAASEKKEYTIKPGSDLQVTKWQSYDDKMGVMYTVLKHDNAYTVHRRYETPKVTAIYRILRLRTGYRIGMVSKPLSQLLPSLTSSEVETQVTEGFDIGIMMAEIDKSESWEDIQDSDLKDIFEMKDRKPLATLGGAIKGTLAYLKRISDVGRSL